MTAGSGGLDTIAVSIHGPAGVVDLVVPPGAAAVDLAREYAEQAALASIPLIYTRTGQPLRPDVALDDAGVETGDVLVATTTVHRPSTPTRHVQPAPPEGPPHPWSAAWFWAAGFLALLAGAFATQAPGELGSVAVALLAAAVVVGVAPVGRYAGHRVLVAPAFAAAAALPVVWDATPERLPLVIGMVGLAAALTAAVGRALATGPDEALRVWMVSGVGLFVLAGLAALAGFSAAVVWSVVLVVCVMAGRFVPMYAVDIGDQYLIDLDRLAVTAWSARERRTGRRGRIVVPESTVARLASGATRTMTAAAAAIAVAAALSSYLLLTRVEPELDRIGVRCLVFFAGAALLLTARSHRHTGPRVLLRVAGLACWGSLGWQLLGELSEPRLAALLGTAIALGLLLVLLAVATGRGWRSVWWSRRAEVAEGFCAAAALASVVASSGLFRTLWEIAP
ncbi:hypothetical protein [Nocardioides sp.]|uniref:hypothetical protein n=1 Tax=Nocardioides sp. TaxID=35761 RepID=UPI002ED036E1